MHDSYVASCFPLPRFAHTHNETIVPHLFTLLDNAFQAEVYRHSWRWETEIAKGVITKGVVLFRDVYVT